ncbi:hypothetical protein HDU76_002069 [Blyttiomyces sp. JEL0837]|nr:hypothetical protein HDU76_002069 [Blyttiomyces sp. JEL0837]
MTNSPTTIALASISIILQFASIFFLLLGHFQNNGLNPIKNYLSEYACAPRSKQYFTYMFWLSALASAVLFAAFAVFYNAAGISLSVDTSTLVGFIALGLMTPFRFFTWFFPLKFAISGPGSASAAVEHSDEEHTTTSTSENQIKYNHNSSLINTLHWVFAVLAYATVIIVATTLPTSYHKLFPNTALDSTALVTEIFGYVALGFIVLMTLSGRFKWGRNGLFQRLYTFFQLVVLILMPVTLAVVASS